MKLSDFTYDLPSELIARYPLPQRTASRLLCLNAQTGAISHQVFSDIETLLHPGDLLVCNNSRVIPARLLGQKPSGGKVEALVERILDKKKVWAHVRASKSPRAGSLLEFAENTQFEVIGRHENLFELKLVSTAVHIVNTDKSDQTCDSAAIIEPNLTTPHVLHVIEAIGQIPLPPYFHRDPEESDKERYQTVFAEHKGSVAAPTAGLHFDTAMMSRLREIGIDIEYVTLHVGAGTFEPVRIEEIEKHRMHSEYIHVTADLCEKIKKTKAQGGRVIAVGTTSLRSLETAALSGEIQPYSGDTDIFIYPGFKFKCIDALITNFHLPGSTLLMLVAALGGFEHIMHAYHAAVSEKYRFFSYGDAMFIHR